MTYAVFTEHVNFMVDKDTKKFVQEQAKKRKVSEATVLRELVRAGRNSLYPRRTR